MATEAEIIASNILASAIEYKRLYDTTKKNEYKVKEQRLRQIAENIKLIVAPGSTSSVSSFNGRTGAVTLTSADVTGALGYTPLATVPTLAQVTTAGNTTTNAINVGDVTSTGVIKSVVSSVTAQFTAYNPTNNYPRAQFQVGQSASDINTGLTIAPLFSSAGVQKPAFIQVSTNKNVSDSGQFSGYFVVNTNLFTIATNKQDGQVAGGVPIAFSPAGVEAMRIQNNGNIQIATTTDAGYKLDVAGTIRSQGTLSIINPSFTNGGSITHSANSTLVITGGPGAGSENITIGPSNRIFINAQQSRFPNGSVQIGSTLTLGNSGNATSTNMLLMQGSITAGSALGRGIGMDTTLIAAANNDILVGLDINPTFTNGAFTGVQNIAARLINSAGINVLFATGVNNSGTHKITFSNAGVTTNSFITSVASGTFSNMNLVLGQAFFDGTTVNTTNNIVIQNNSSTVFEPRTAISYAYLTGDAYVVTALNNTNAVLGFSNGSNATSTRGAAIFAIAGGSFASTARLDFAISNVNAPVVTTADVAMSLFNSKNFGIGTTTDSGYKLQVNGNASIKGSAGTTGLYADFGNSGSIVQIASHGSTDFTQIRIGNNFSLSRNGGGDPTIETTFGLGVVSTSLSLQTSTASPGKLWLRGNYGLGSAYLGANNSNGVTASTLYFQNSETPTAAQNVIATFNLWAISDNATAPSIPASSIFSLQSTTRGFLQPRMTNAQAVAITTPATGLQVYDTTNNKNLLYNGTAWQNIATETWVSAQGYLTSAPAGAQFKIDYDPNITGVKNGSNLLFTTSSTFIATTTRVFLNGQRLTRGATYDYVETGTNQITFAAAPVPTDQIIIEYQI